MFILKKNSRLRENNFFLVYFVNEMFKRVSSKMNLVFEYHIEYIVSYCCTLCVQVNLTVHYKLISICIN